MRDIKLIGKFLIITLICSCIVFCGCSDSGFDDDVAQTGLPIIHGTPDKREAHLGVVALVNKNKGYVFCSGTLVHPQWVLTAGHCLNNFDFNDRVNPAHVEETQVVIGNTIDDAAYFDADNFYIYPGYNAREVNVDGKMDDVIEGDIGLIRLKKPVPENIAKPIYMYIKDIKFPNLQESVEFVGFGYDENSVRGIKKAYSLPIKHYCETGKKCKIGADYCAMPEVEVDGCHPLDVDKNGQCKTGLYYSSIDRPLVACGAFYYDQHDGGACNGDSGGPALITVEGNEYLLGITSWGDEICSVYGVSTSVRDYSDWIYETAPEIGDIPVPKMKNGGCQAVPYDASKMPMFAWICLALSAVVLIRRRFFI